jgi:hypothetical protein
VYGGDITPYPTHENRNIIGEFNQIDSLIEYVTEIIFHDNNAFPENGNHTRHNNSQHQIKHISIKMINFKKKNADMPFYCTAPRLPEILKEEYKNLFLQEINPPPPKA